MADCVTIGSDFTARGTFRNSADTLETPTAYTVTYVDPSGNSATIVQGSITVVSTGVLDATIPTDELGKWNYRWNTTVDGAALVVAGSFCVKADGVT